MSIEFLTGKIPKKKWILPVLWMIKNNLDGKQVLSLYENEANKKGVL